MQETEKIWMNGELVDWADAKVHVGVHGLHYGSGVFEGVRCYDTPKGPAVFRLGEHMQRLHNSAKLLYMDIPYSVDDLRTACNELIGINGLPECYIRPIAAMWEALPAPIQTSSKRKKLLSIRVRVTAR